MKRFQKTISVLLILVILTAIGSIQGFSTTGLIFNSGFEPGSVGVPVTNDSGAIKDITGTDNSFTSENDWVTNYDNHANIGSHVIQYEVADNSHQRYARIVKDPTDMLFEDSFDDSYAIGDEAHINNVVNDKRNWKERVIGSNASITVVQDPLESDYAMEFRNISGVSTGPRLEEVVDAAARKSITVEYKVMTKGKSTKLEVALPLASAVPSAVPVTVINTTATAGGQTASVSADAWVSVKVELDFHYNLMNVSINDTPLVTGAALFSTSQSSADLTQVRLRLTSTLSTLNAYTLLDDVMVYKSPTKFEDSFDLSYAINDAPHVVANDTGRINWTAYATGEATVNIQADELNATNKVLKFLRTGSGNGYPRVDKHLDISSAPRISIEYKIMTKSRLLPLEVALPSVSGAPSKTLISFSTSNNATVGASTMGIDPNAWTTVKVDCDLYKNTYTATVNGSPLGGIQTLFATAQKDWRNVRIRFNSTLPQNAYYYLDAVKISNTANQVMKYYAGKVINDSKLRIQSGTSSNNNMNEYYFKYRVYFNESLADLYDALAGVNSYWITLGEIFDGSCWAWTPDQGPNYTSRVTLGIQKPTSAGTPLKFHVDHQQAKIDAPEFNSTPIWAYESSVDLPIGKWATIEIYVKHGLGTSGDGQFQMFMTTEDGIRQTVFNINQPTYHPNASVDGFEHAWPLKLYGNKLVFNNFNTAKKDIQIYWDDYEIRGYKPY